MQDVRLEKNIEDLVFTHPETRCARGESPQVRSGFFVVKIFDILRFIVKTSVFQIGFECSRAIESTSHTVTSYQNNCLNTSTSLCKDRYNINVSQIA